MWTLSTYEMRSLVCTQAAYIFFIFRGASGYIHSDNGHEFTLKAVRRWLNDIGVNMLFIERGTPWENGYIESFNGKARDELLDREILKGVSVGYGWLRDHTYLYVSIVVTIVLALLGILLLRKRRAGRRSVQGIRVPELASV